MMERDSFPSMRVGVRSSVNVTLEMMRALIQQPALHALLDSFRDPVLLCDGENRVRLINLAAEQINRLPREDAVGTSLEVFLERSALSVEGLKQFTQRAMSSTLAHSRDGRSFLVRLHTVPMGLQEKPFALIVQREVEGKRGARRYSSAPSLSASVERGLDDPQEGTLHLSAQLSQIADTGIRAFRRRARLLLLGEPGVGKTAIARHIHRAAGWENRPFIHVNCGSIPETLFESEMFGYERGAFTGALQAGKRGYIESAAGGTLFLDEIGEIPLPVQAKLLKFLEDGTIQSVGSPLPKSFSVQVIVATNKDLRRMVDLGEFRADLYYRLAVLSVEIPPLREHMEDMPVLMDVLLARINRDRQPPLRLSGACRERLMQHHYPGNIRELVNIFERLAVLADEEAQVQHLPAELQVDAPKHGACEQYPPVLAPVEEDLGLPNGAASSLKALVQRFERDIILKAVQSEGSKRKAAGQLGIDIGTLIRKLQRD